LYLLVVIPTVTAVAAGGIFIASSVQSALVYQRVVTLANLSGKITGLVQALQGERADTVRFIVLGSNGGRSASPGPELSLVRQDDGVTNGWAGQVTALAAGIGGSYPALARQDAQAAIAEIGSLPAIRSAATGTLLPAQIVIEEYGTVISGLLAVESQIAVGSGDSTLAGAVRVLGLVSSMKEEASQQQAILISALSPDQVSLGQFGPAQELAITDALAQQQGNQSEFDTAATPSQLQLLNSALSSANVVQAQAQEQQAVSLASSRSAIATDPTISDASSALSYLVSGMRSTERQLASSVIARSGSLHDQAIILAVIYSIAVALLLGIALGSTIIVGRSLVGPLRRLRNGALEVAGDRLPQMVRRMSEAGGDGVPTEVVPIDVDSIDEIGEVARAFDQVHQEALRLAGNEALLRGNVSAMFINLSRRSVPLIDRLGHMIDSLELTEDDPSRLSGFFAMDHLLTRMRRNSENLLVLAGEEPVRKWLEPVPLVDVVRAATSEIEQYSRVQLNVEPGVVVSGHAAADLVHLLAEIIENATMFSPPDTPVYVQGQAAPGGDVLLDITDSGLGIPPSRLSEINWRLENPPLIDVSVSQHMGLFAVSRLAARHGVRVRLRPAPSQGLSAMVWLPESLIGRETVSSTTQRPHQWSEDSASAQPRVVGGRRVPGRHYTPGLGGQQQPMAAGRMMSSWFHAKRPSGRGVLGVGAATLGAAGDVPAMGQGGPVAPTWGAFTAPAHGMAAPGTPAREAVGAPPQGTPGIPAQNEPNGTMWTASGPRSRQAPGLDMWPDDGAQAAEKARMPVYVDHTSSGLPLRVPGSNMIPGSVGGATAGGPAADEAQAPGRQAGNPETDQEVMPPRQSPLPRRSPEQARARLRGFQLGSREAETWTPNPGEEATR
jgi:signal transduction histidine kinase